MGSTLAAGGKEREGNNAQTHLPRILINTEWEWRLLNDEGIWDLKTMFINNTVFAMSCIVKLYTEQLTLEHLAK